MGLFQKLAHFLGVKRREVNVLVVGLNNSGKSTVVNRFKHEDERVMEIVPTVGFSVERFQSKFYFYHSVLEEMPVQYSVWLKRKNSLAVNVSSRFKIVQEQNLESHKYIFKFIKYRFRQSSFEYLGIPLSFL